MYGGSPVCPYARIYHSTKLGDRAGCYCGHVKRAMGELNEDGSFNIPDSCIIDDMEVINTKFCGVCGKTFHGDTVMIKKCYVHSDCAISGKHLEND
jgi:hypothetical protein